VGEAEAKIGAMPSGASRPARGRLSVYLGIAPGAGKTYAMLAEANHLAAHGVDVVIGLVETHQRSDTEAMLKTLERIPPRRIAHHGASLDELDLDAVLARRPQSVVVDELAHSCVPGCRHEKRWQDVEELLDAGMDVITSLNVQHIDSLREAVISAIGITPHETVPDAVIAAADRIEFIDVTPQDLRARIAGSDILNRSAAPQALSGFFTTEHLAALRGLALDWLRRHHHDATMPHQAPFARHRHRSKVVAALTGAAEGERVLHRAAQITASLNGELIGVYVREAGGLTQPEPVWLAGQRRILSELGGQYVELADVDVARAIVEFTRSEDAHQLVLGATRRSRWQELLHGSVINKAIRTAGPVEIHVIPWAAPRRRWPVPMVSIPSLQPAAFPVARRAAAWLAAVVLPAAFTLCLTPFRANLGVAGALMADLLAVVAAALLGGILPALVATAAAVLLADFYFTAPLHSLRVADVVDVVALTAFGIVAIAVGGLVDLLTRQGVHAAAAYAESNNLARLAAAAVASTDDLTGVLESIRRALRLDTVAVLRTTQDGWQVEATAGPRVLDRPDAADHQVAIGPARILALTQTSAKSRRTTSLQNFLSELRLARQQAMLQALSEPNHLSGTLHP